jgi:hypothetical protein
MMMAETYMDDYNTYADIVNILIFHEGPNVLLGCPCAYPFGYPFGYLVDILLDIS